MSHGVISADSHMDLEALPPDTFTARVPAERRDQVPRVVETPDGQQWVAGKNGEYACGLWGPSYAKRHTRGVRVQAMDAAGFKWEDRRPANPALRMEDQDKDGVDAEVIYGIFRLQLYVTDMDLIAGCFAAYNEYIAEFCQTNPNRFHGLGCLPGNTIEAAVEEIKHVAKLGLKGAEWSYVDRSKPVWHPYWEPLWAAAEEYNIPISLHSRGRGTTSTVGIDADVVESGKFGKNPVSEAAFIVVSQMQLDEALVSMLYCGALERYPNLKIVLGESGTGWIPFVLERADYEWEDDHLGIARGLSNTQPSELFRRQMYATFQKDSVGPSLAEQWCPNNLMWGSDYPHTDGVWPDSPETIQRYLGGVSEETRRKIVHDNVASLYGIR